MGGKIRAVNGKVKLVAANGTDIPVHGEKIVKFNAGDKSCGMNLLVTDVKKPLAAVSAIVDEGNVVVFGPGDGGSFIQNISTGEKIAMKRKKGTYVIEVDFDHDGRERSPKMDVCGLADGVEAEASVFSRQA